MRWTYPSVRDSRIRSGFLWIPRVVGNDVRWLEFAKWRETFRSSHYYAGWIITEWLD